MDVIAGSMMCSFLQAVLPHLTLELAGLHIFKNCHWVILTPIDFNVFPAGQRCGIVRLQNVFGQCEPYRLMKCNQCAF